MYDLTKKEKHGHGAYSNYYRISDKVGIKALIPEVWGEETDTKSEAQEEMAFLKQAQKSGITPRPIGIIQVKFSRYNKIMVEYGVMMQHLDAITLRDYCDKYGVDAYDIVYRNDETVKDYAYRKMEESGITHSDLHSQNIMVEYDRDTGKITKVYVIDFSPARINTD